MLLVLTIKKNSNFNLINEWYLQCNKQYVFFNFDTKIIWALTMQSSRLIIGWIK